jgi:hypothetical protein
MLVYKYSQIPDDNRISYQESMKLCKNKMGWHLGQLKLFFSELLFLAMHAKPGDRVVYVGAAPGYHITKLADLFPDVMFDLWDPREFEVEKRSNISTHQAFFTDVVANTYAQSKERILVMCDIRTLRIAKLKKAGDIESMDELVDDDMRMQKNWCQIIKPAYAYLKFRLPYEIPKTKYLKGTIFLQPYSKVSTEARLLTNNYSDQILYDNIMFQEKLAYHNGYTRCQSKTYPMWKPITDKYNLVNNWDNAYAIRITHFYLENVKGVKSMDETGKLFMDIVNYHVGKYGDKYKILFNKSSTGGYI